MTFARYECPNRCQVELSLQRNRVRMQHFMPVILASAVVSRRPTIAAMSRIEMSATSWPTSLSLGLMPICTLPPPPFKKSQIVSPRALQRGGRVLDLERFGLARGDERLEGGEGDGHGVCSDLNSSPMRGRSCRSPG